VGIVVQQTVQKDAVTRLVATLVTLFVVGAVVGRQNLSSAVEGMRRVPRSMFVVTIQMGNLQAVERMEAVPRLFPMVEDKVPGHHYGWGLHSAQKTFRSQNNPMHYRFCCSILSKVLFD